MDEQKLDILLAVTKNSTKQLLSQQSAVTKRSEIAF